MDADKTWETNYLRPLHCLLLLAAAGVSHAQTVTFSEHIAPIIYNNCTTCHRTGQVAPFTLSSYSDVKKHGPTVAATTQSGYMPPWKPERVSVAYRDEKRLTPNQISLIQQWVAGGMPEGDASKTPPLPQFTDGWQLGTPDLILEMPEGYSVPANGDDIYRNFVIPTGLKEDKWVKAIELRPTAHGVVHHSLFFSDTSGNARAMDGKDGSPGFPGFASIFELVGAQNAFGGGLGAWVPGTTAKFLPNGISMPLPKGSDFLLQTHFHLNGLAQTEKTQVGIFFGDKPDRELTQLQVPAFFGTNAHIDIPAGESSYKLRGTYTLPVGVDAVSIWAHAHYLGKESKLTATLPNGEVRVLLWIRDWDLNWQDQYVFSDLVYLPANTRLDGELIYDNSTNNVHNPNSPPKRVTWGENSTSEMGSLLLNVVPHVASDISALKSSQAIFTLFTPIPLVGNRPLLVSSGVVDGASAQPSAATPGKVMVLYGDRIGPTGLATASIGSDGKFANQIAGTQVLFDDVAAPMLYSSAGQTAVVVPYGIDGKNGTQLKVRNGALTSDPIALQVTPAAPSLFSVDLTGTGQAAVINVENFKVNSSLNPASKGSFVSLYATGEGQTQPGGIDGLIASGPTLPKPVKEVKVFINGAPAEVTYAGAAPGLIAGVLQVNVKVPADAPSGQVPVQLVVGGFVSQQGMTISVR